MNKLDLASVVVLYYPQSKNLKFLDNIKDCVDKIYIIDNSDDDVIRFKSTKKVKYIKNGYNIGVAAALNIGAQRAINDKYKWLLTLDQDSNINSNIILKMKEYILNSNIERLGVVSPFHVIKYDFNKPLNNCEKVLEVMTSGNIINLDIYKKVGGFKNWLFIDNVDIDYCLNINNHGYDVIRLNNVLMKHNLGDRNVKKFFGKTIVCSNHNADRRYYMIRNTLYINDLYKNLFPDFCKYLIKSQVGQIKRVLLFENHKCRKIFMMMKGYIDYKRGIKGKIKPRG